MLNSKKKNQKDIGHFKMLKEIFIGSKAYDDKTDDETDDETNDDQLDTTDMPDLESE